MSIKMRQEGERVIMSFRDDSDPINQQTEVDEWLSDVVEEITIIKGGGKLLLDGDDGPGDPAEPIRDEAQRERIRRTMLVLTRLKNEIKAIRREGGGTN